eukprot:16447474-Heterocapsa_arctica.AAC.1
MKPRMIPERFIMNGSERQPAPIDEETSVKTPASIDPSPIGFKACVTMRDMPTDSSAMGLNRVESSEVMLSLLFWLMLRRIR